MTEITAEHWDITEDGKYPSQRTFLAKPKEKLVLDYKTVEQYHGRFIDVTYPAVVEQVRITHMWDEKKQAWWGQTSMSIFLLNPRTMERYAYSNWKSERIHPREETVPLEPEINRILIEATAPKTKIVMTEVPL